MNDGGLGRVVRAGLLTGLDQLRGKDSQDSYKLVTSPPIGGKARFGRRFLMLGWFCPTGPARWRPPNQVRSEEAALRGDRQVPLVTVGAIFTRTWAGDSHQW